MNINFVLKKEGIEILSKLNSQKVEKIANIVSEKICKAFPEYNLNPNNISSNLENIDMYIAKLPQDSAIAKYFSQNNSIYFSHKMDFEHIDTLVIHECIHALQEIKNSHGKLQKMGLFNVVSNKGQGINEAAVQLMASIATESKIDNVKYYNMDLKTSSPLFYPIETALINEMIYFTGSYSLFHSTLFSNDIFKKTFIIKSNEKIYQKIEENFDLLIHYEDLLSLCFLDLSNCSENSKEINKINKKIDKIKTNILNLTLYTQNMIIENCFNSEFDLIKDPDSLNRFQERLYNFNKLIISTKGYNFYDSFYRHMMNQLEEKRELIKTYGTLNYLSDLQNDLLDLQKESFGFSFFRRLFDKLKLLFEETVRNKNSEDI